MYLTIYQNYDVYRIEDVVLTGDRKGLVLSKSTSNFDGSITTNVTFKSMVDLIETNEVRNNKIYNLFTISENKSLSKLNNPAKIVLDEKVKLTDNLEILNILTDKIAKLGGKLNLFEKGDYERIIAETGVDVNKVKAFTFNGEVYLNKELATIDEPLHEMLHLILNTLKSTDFDMFSRIVSSISILDTQKLSKEYDNLSDLDKAEEVFVRIFSNKVSSNLKDNPDVNLAIKKAIETLFESITSLSDKSLTDVLDENTIDFLNKFGSGLVSNNSSLYSKNEAVEMIQVTNKKKDLIANKSLEKKCE